MAPFFSSVLLLLAIQAPQASIAGAVRDQATGAPLPGAVVTLPELERVAVADVSGRYLLADVPAGPQHIAVRFLGYAPRTLHALVPAAGLLELGVSLERQPLRLQTIEVRPPPAIRGLEAEPTTAYADRELTLAAVRNHPLLAEPDALQALSGGEVAAEPESPSGLHVRGGESDQVAYLLDGIPVFSPYHSAGTFTAFNPDALAGLRLSSTAPSATAPGALAGVVAAETRAPGARHQAQGSVSTTQARLAFDGPLGAAGAGYLVALRSGFPGYPAPESDPSYLRSESGDRLLKLEAPAYGGRVLLLGYDNENEIDAAAGPENEEPVRTRNRFEWGSQSFGLAWQGSSPAAPSLLAWSASTQAGAGWSTPGGRLVMRSTRRDLGLQFWVRTGTPSARTLTGARLERSETEYSVGAWKLGGRTPVASAFVEHHHAIGARAWLHLGATLAAGRQGVHLLPRMHLAWSPVRSLTLSTGLAASHQSAQSLRNPESVVGSVFPADLYIGSGAPGVPGARARLVVLAADYRPALGIRLGLQAYRRKAEGLLLVAPYTGEPFATGRFGVGSGSAHGLSASFAANGARVGILASYGLQRVRLDHGDSSYVPAHGMTHAIEAGVIVHPTATLSLRLGTVALAGRRTTVASGGLEWESCNLLDRGCELVGSPRYGGEPLGARRLPAYVRIDLAARQHWHLQLAGRDIAIALFGTVSNVLGRRNLLTYVADPTTGELAAIDMRPFAPLVVGVDWQF